MAIPNIEFWTELPYGTILRSPAQTVMFITCLAGNNVVVALLSEPGRDWVGPAQLSTDHWEIVA